MSRFLTSDLGGRTPNIYIEFLEEPHVYTVNGVIGTSVTTILKNTLFQKKYDGVPIQTLKQAAAFGTGVHKAIQNGTTTGLNQVQRQCVIQYEKVLERAGIVVTGHEIMVARGQDYVGTIDLVGELKGVPVLADIKTTRELDEEYVSWQLSFYRYALLTTYGILAHQLYAIHVPKGKAGRIVEVPIKSEEAINEVLLEYGQKKKMD